MKFLFLAFALSVSVDASARILVGKELISKWPVAQQENVFEYQIINTGDTAAVNVEFSDRDSFPTNQFDIVKGSTTAKFALIPPQTTAYHHIVVVPRVPQMIEDKDVTVDYTDATTKKVSRVSTLWYSKGQFTHFFHPDALRRLKGTDPTHFAVFALIVSPTTVLSAFLYWRSKSSYAVTKKD